MSAYYTCALCSVVNVSHRKNYTHLSSYCFLIKIHHTQVELVDRESSNWKGKSRAARRGTQTGTNHAVKKEERRCVSTNKDEEAWPCVTWPCVTWPCVTWPCVTWSFLNCRHREVWIQFQLYSEYTPGVRRFICYISEFYLQ